VKTFFKSVLRIATAILLVIVVLGLGAWGITSCFSYRESRRNAALETPKKWPTITHGEMVAGLSTIWRDGSMFYKFETAGPPKSSTKKEWFLEFVDSGGFEVFRHTLRDGSRVVGPDGETIGFDSRGQALISADDYRRISGWQLAWSD
jgi:hypothetical protein